MSLECAGGKEIFQDLTPCPVDPMSSSLAMGKALMLKPTLLLADEPSLGLSPNFVDLIFDKLIEINKNGTSILLVEQNAQMALEVCHRGYIFEIGSIALEGKKEKLVKNKAVKKAFLGG